MVSKFLHALAATLALSSFTFASPITLFRRTPVLDSVVPPWEQITLSQNPTEARITYTIDEAKENLIVTYSDLAGYSYKEVHLYIGTVAPESHAPGQMPYTSNNGACTIAPDSQTASCTIPLTNLGNDLCANPTTPFYIASHAAHISDSDPLDLPTSWGSGPSCIGKVLKNGKCPSWAMYSSFQFVCKEPPPPPPPVVNKKFCPRGTAYGYPLGSTSGDSTMTIFELRSIGTGGGGKGNSNANAGPWGWYFSVTAPSLSSGNTITGNLHVGAGDNDRNKGFVAGPFSVQGTSTGVTVKYSLTGTYDLVETHVYASCTVPDKAAPGNYGNEHQLDGYDPIDQSDVYTFESSAAQLAPCWGVEGKNVYFILHASVGEVVDDVEGVECGKDYGETGQ